MGSDALPSLPEEADRTTGRSMETQLGQGYPLRFAVQEESRPAVTPAMLSGATSANGGLGITVGEWTATAGTVQDLTRLEVERRLAGMQRQRPSLWVSVVLETQRVLLCR